MLRATKIVPGRHMERHAGRRRAPRLRPAHAPPHRPHGSGRPVVPARSRQGARAALRRRHPPRRRPHRRVEAAPERLLEITCRDERALARIAWHLGNRHLATEIGDRIIHIRDDHVIADMVRGPRRRRAPGRAPLQPRRRRLRPRRRARPQPRASSRSRMTTAMTIEPALGFSLPLKGEDGTARAWCVHRCPSPQMLRTH